MKIPGLWLAALLISAGGLPAQVLVEVNTKQSAFLPSEPITAAVRITNRSGQTLQLGTDNDWLTFNVEALDGYVVVKNGDVPVLEPFKLESSKVATKRVDVSPYFDFSKPGRYTITASVKIKEWGAQIVSDPKTIDIVRGVTLWEQEFGVPQSPTNHEQPEVRKYALQKAVFYDNMLLYLRLTDQPESQVFKVFPLGSLASFSQPETKLDRVSNLHLLYQNGMRTYTYYEVSPQGDVLKKQKYDYAQSRPILAMDDSGQVVVAGGVRRLVDDDPPTAAKQ